MGTFLLVLGTGAIAASAALFAACLRLRTTVAFLLASYLLASAEVVGVSLVLSIGRWLTRDALLLGAGTLLLAGVLTWVSLGRPRPPLSTENVRALRVALGDPVVAAVAGLAVVSHVYLLAGALTVPQGAGDTLLYHLPRAALWKQQHAVDYVANSPDERINAFPPNAEIESMTSMILSGGDRYVSIVQFVALLFTCVAIFGVSRRLGLSTRAGAFAALAYSTFTVVALQTPTALNDLAVASVLMACAYFAMSTSRAELALAALALALALGTKLTTVFLLPALALFALSSQPRRRWASLVLVGGVGAVAGSFWLVVNLGRTGRPDAGVVLDRGADPIAERIRLTLVDLLELSDAEGKGLLLSPLWGGGAFVVALFVAAVFAARKKSGASGIAVLVGALAFCAVPMLSIWALVAERAFGQVRSAIGLTSTAVGARVPEALYESPMHSSYGLGFVVLLLGAGTLVVLDVARRTLPVAALAALVSVPLTLVILAVVLAYDPQHMRYIAFPVALATAVFGVAARVRVLAWATVICTALTLTVTLAYFAPRPAGVALLPGNRDANRTARWLVQGESGRGDPAAFRFLEEEIPADATLALAVERDTYLYPAWDAGLRRTVLFEHENGSIPDAVDWLVVGPRHSVDTEGLSRAGWRLEFASPGGWSVFRR